MTEIKWGVPGSRYFHHGVDRGVLYPPNAEGVPWDGLLSVNESPTGGTAKPYYIDGMKYRNESSPEEFAGTIQAFTYPDEFALLDGTADLGNGLYAAQQPRLPFGLSYRSLVGNDLEGPRHAYLIHLIYMALAEPSSVGHSTIGSSDEAAPFSWNITTSPVAIINHAPTAHLIIDSRDTPPLLLRYLEKTLYGSAQSSPRLPPPSELAQVFEYWRSLRLLPNQQGVSYLVDSELPDLTGLLSTGVYDRAPESRLSATSPDGLYTLEDQEF